LRCSALWVVAGQGGFEAVLDRQQFAGELLDGELAGLANIFLGAAADVLAFRLGAQPGRRGARRP
jgi:hypothetical protein